MNETSKTRRLREKAFESMYLQGRALDNGAGGDLVVAHAESFDITHGDANHILKYRSAEQYDCAYSSHCLEHMNDLPAALRQSWELVRIGGYLIFVVPDEDLYEQGFWPSLFASGHKATFRIGKTNTWSPVSHEIRDLVSELPGAEVVSAVVHDDQYDYSLQTHGFRRYRRLLYGLSQWALANMSAVRLQDSIFGHFISRCFGLMGAPTDQTAGNALAQIEVIVHKVRSESDHEANSRSR